MDIDRYGVRDPKYGWNSLFILDNDFKVHSLAKLSHEDSFQLTKTIDFSHHKLKQLQCSDWNSCHITSRVLVYADIMFQSKSDRSPFLLNENMHTSEWE